MYTSIKKSAIWKLMLVVFLWFSCTLSTRAQIEKNGSFENSTVGVISNNTLPGWFIQTASGITPAPVYEIVTNEAQDGTKAFKVSINGTGTNNWDIQLVADSIPVRKGGNYTLSVWAKCASGSAQVNFTVGYYSYAEIKAIRQAALINKWKRFTMQFTVAENQKYIRAPIHFSYDSNSGNAIYIDNFQISDDDAKIEPVVVQAESGKLGSNLLVRTDNNIKYISAKSNYSGLTNPGDTSRIATYQVTFPDSGEYNLFARLRVGSNGYDDDSFFYAKSFGIKKDTSSTDWQLINGLAGAGFTDSTVVVDGPGTLGSGVWKWVNISKNNYSGGKGVTFKVDAANLIQTFQISSREDGLDIDKLAFGKANLFFTVGALNNGLPGVKSIDSTLIWKGPALATGQAKFLGNTEDVPKSFYTKYWNQITAGNAGKWGSVAGSIDTTKWNWTTLDNIYNFALTNKIIFKDHTLIWGAQQPSWINGLDKTEQAKYIESWIRQVGKRYPKMDMVDVVNEPLVNHNQPDGGSGRANYKEALGGNGTTGWDWVINSFQLARKYISKSTKLLLNDYGIINDNNATTSYLGIINLLKDRGLIDGIGVQGHRFEFERADTNVLKSNLNRLGATGLPVYISEFDLGNLDNASPQNDNEQLQLYKKIFPVIWKHSAVKGITLWGYMVGEMWQSTCGLVNADGTSRPALVWLADYIKKNPVGVEEDQYGLPVSFHLEQNFPNPFNPSTVIKYQVPKFSHVVLKVYDILGRIVSTLVNEKQTAGYYNVTFNANNLSSGVYFYELIADQNRIVKKMLFMK